jgi:hypothetical protein
LSYSTWGVQHQQHISLDLQWTINVGDDTCATELSCQITTTAIEHSRMMTMSGTMNRGQRIAQPFDIDFADNGVPRGIHRYQPRGARRGLLFVEL